MTCLLYQRNEINLVNCPCMYLYISFKNWYTRYIRLFFGAYHLFWAPGRNHTGRFFQAVRNTGSALRPPVACVPWVGHLWANCVRPLPLYESNRIYAKSIGKNGHFGQLPLLFFRLLRTGMFCHPYLPAYQSAHNLIPEVARVNWCRHSIGYKKSPPLPGGD